MKKRQYLKKIGKTERERGRERSKEQRGKNISFITQPPGGAESIH